MKYAKEAPKATCDVSEKKSILTVIPVENYKAISEAFSLLQTAVRICLPHKKPA